MSKESNNVAGEISPATSALSSAGGTALGAVVNGISQSALMSKQNEINFENWQRQNEYNLPINQYRRYVSAGMSPSAAMQAIAGIESSAGSVGSVTPSHPASSTNLLSDYFKGQNLMLDKKTADAEIAMKRAEADYYDSMTNRNATLTPLEAKKLIADARQSVSSANLSESQKDMQDYLLERSKRFESSEFDELQARINELYTRSESNKASALLSHEKASTEDYIRKNLAMDSYKKSREAFHIDADTDRIEYQNRLLNFKQIVREFYHADPDSPMFSQFLQASAAGDPGATAIWMSLAGLADNAISTIGQSSKKHPLLSSALLYEYLTNSALNKGVKVSSIIGNILPFRGGSSVSPSSYPSLTPNWRFGFSKPRGTHQFNAD